jgi:perosamine synthetase
LPGPDLITPYLAAHEPNYYILVLRCLDNAAAKVIAAGLPPDSIRFGYQPLYHRQIFTRYATSCPNAEALCAATFQLPVHPRMTPAALGWVADRIRVLVEGYRS